MISAQRLKETQRGTRDQFADQDFGTRVHRAISWIQRAEHEDDDPDARFIFSWIGFNALYGRVTEHQIGDRNLFNDLFRDLVRFDNKRLYKAIWETYSGPIKLLLENEFVFEPYWRHLEGDPGERPWEERFEQDQENVRKALQRQNTAQILSVLFNRLYVLRNQIFHGSATWQSSVNRDQVRDGSRILSALLPLIVDIMMANHEHGWGSVHYPVVDD